jgi:ferrochelatase
MKRRTAVLLMAHGTPDSLDEMPEYLTRVRNGRPPSAELVREISANYAAIGGRSPLTDITLRQGAALQHVLGPDIPVLVGMRNWKPYIPDVLCRIAGTGIDHVIGIPLAPQFSTLSVQKYVDVAAAAMPPGVHFDCVRSFHDHPLLIEAFAERVREARPRPDEGEEVLFTAHSLPVRVVEAGDPYPGQVAATAAGVAAAAGIGDYQVAYQSAGRTPEPWLGPDIGERIRKRAALGVRRILVVPIGFVADHTEILFDIDVQAARVAAQCAVAANPASADTSPETTPGVVTLRRTESLNTSPAFIRLLAALVEEASHVGASGR